MLKVDAPRDDPVVPTRVERLEAANWQEREVYDLLGVTLRGPPRPAPPPDARGLVGHPLRKDYVEPEEYHGISTTRESLLKA